MILSDKDKEQLQECIPALSEFAHHVKIIYNNGELTPTNVYFVDPEGDLPFAKSHSNCLVVECVKTKDGPMLEGAGEVNMLNNKIKRLEMELAEVEDLRKINNLLRESIETYQRVINNLLDKQ